MTSAISLSRHRYESPCASGPAMRRWCQRRPAL